MIPESISHQMYCDCNDPWEFLFFEFNIKHPWKGKNKQGEVAKQPELWIRGHFYHGTLWQRIRNAWKYIVKGEYRSQVDILVFGKDKIENLHKFTQECIKMLEQHRVE